MTSQQRGTGRHRNADAPGSLPGTIKAMRSACRGRDWPRTTRADDRRQQCKDDLQGQAYGARRGFQAGHIRIEPGSDARAHERCYRQFRPLEETKRDHPRTEAMRGRGRGKPAAADHPRRRAGDRQHERRFDEDRDGGADQLLQQKHAAGAQGNAGGKGDGEVDGRGAENAHGWKIAARPARACRPPAGGHKIGAPNAEKSVRGPEDEV